MSLLQLSQKDLDREIEKILKEAPKPKSNFWTPKEDEILRRLYGKVDTTVVMEKLGRTRCSIEKRSAILGLKFRKN